ncbi:MAG TPA: DUF1214 domain-containing protein [Acidimicrobiales bacterium]|nr:DUF1214 domain-containing protein [Acidimicrobiales bacterium]
MNPLPTWADQMKALDGVVDRLMAAWRPDGATEAERQDMNKYALSALASGYHSYVYTNARRPAFMPLWNYASPQGGPNPDYVYSSAQVDSGGVYQISGYRGTSRFVEITQQQEDLPSTSLEPPKERPLRETRDLDEFTVGSDGAFGLILSAERPDGYNGDWWQLDPRARRLLMRKCACDWKQEVDARVAINRLDDPGEDMTPEEIATRFSDLPKWIEGRILHEIRLVRYYREHHGINVLLKSKWIEQVGGLAKQAYYDGIHQIDDDEALIVEVPLPAKCHYWQILVADDRFVTVDWVNRQSSLNDTQAHVDPDGRLRAVVSKRDPGVHNWLDKADYPWGIIQMRLYLASEHPETTVTKVPVSEVAEHLPADTRFVTPAERHEQLRARREAAQLRQIW